MAARRPNRENAFLYIVPALIFVLIAELTPVVYTIYLGFMEWDVINPPKWAGLENYLRVFSTPDLLNALKNTAVWVGGTIVFSVGLALVIAVLINQVRLKSVFKAIFFIPATLSPTVASIFWSRVLVSQKGALVSIFELFGGSLQPLITNAKFNTFIMIGIWTWQYLGINLILFLVGLETIPQEPIEAARIDGANSWRLFYHIILPLLQPIMLLVVANAVINSIRMFDIPWVMIQGGPGRSSETLAVSLYRESFLLFQMGLGSAIAVVISAFSFLASYRYLVSIGGGRKR